MSKIQKLLFGFVVITLLATCASVWTIHSALAATGSLYLSPSSQSVQNSNTFTVSLRVNPGGSIDTVNASISYDAAKLNLVSIDCTGTAFTAVPSCPTGGNPISITAANLGGAVTSDSLVAKVTFRASVGSGSTTIGLSGNAASNGTATNPTVVPANVSFTNPPCGSGQTGTWPNCVTASAPSSNSSSSSTNTNKSAPTTSNNSGSASNSSSTTTGSTKNTTTPAASTSTAAGSTAATVSPVAVDITASNVQYTTVSLSVKTAQPTSVYVSYGTDQQHYINTPASPLSIDHSVSLDASLLVPGQTYYYVVVSKDQSGKITQTNVRTLKTKGLSVKVAVFDKTRQPLRNKVIILHSQPNVAKTDNYGYVTFNDVIPGSHHVTFTSGKQSYSQEIAVTNTVQQNGNIQTATVQNVSVLLPVTQAGTLTSKLLPLLFLTLLIAVGYLAYRRGLLQYIQGRMALKPQYTDVPVVVPAPQQTAAPTVGLPPRQITVQDELNAINGSDSLVPGSTITPNQTKDDQI